MKKILLVVGTLLQFSFLMQAQSVNSVMNVRVGYKDVPMSIVRPHQRGHTISYGFTSGVAHYLLYADHTFFTMGLGTPASPTRITLPSFIYQIHDMRVTNGYVYLCGQTKSNTGFIGYMDMSVIASPTSSTVALNYMEIPQTTCLVRLAAYNLGMMTTTEKVVAVGHNSNSYVDHYIVEVNNILSGMGSYRYATVPNEVLHEVFEVASGVVFVGYSRDCGTLTLRKGDWNNALTTSTVQNRYCYTSSEEVHARTISDTDFSKIAVSYLHYDRPSDVYSTRIRYIDLATMEMENSQEFFTGEKSGPVAMTHVPYLNSPILLQPFTYPATGPLSTKSPFILLDRDATSSYSAQVLCHPGMEYSSLHYCGGSFFAACAYGKLYYQDVSLPMTSSFACIMRRTLPVNRIDDLPLQTAVTPMVPVSTASAMRTVICMKDYPLMTLNCSN